MELAVYSGAGNRFALFDGDAPEDVVLSVFLAADSGLDGLLVLSPPRSGGDVALTIFNRDGSRAENCGNGLRCVAWHVVTSGRASGGTVRIETEAGTREAELIERGEDSGLVRVSMGAARTFALTAPIEHAGRSYEATGAELGNPHCVLIVADEREEPLEELGPALQAHPDFPDGANVGCLAERDGAFHLRVWERGVGETAACGSGACAAACALVAAGRAEMPVELHMPGGPLSVDRDAGGELRLSGEAREEEGRLCGP